MKIEEKNNIAKTIYNELNIKTEDFNVSRIDEIKADVFLPKDMQRGTNGIIIGDDGSYYVCGSVYPLEHYIEEFKNGMRDNLDSRK